MFKPGGGVSVSGVSRLKGDQKHSDMLGGVLNSRQRAHMHPRNYRQAHATHHPGCHPLLRPSRVLFSPLRSKPLLVAVILPFKGVTTPTFPPPKPQAGTTRRSRQANRQRQGKQTEVGKAVVAWFGLRICEIWVNDGLVLSNKPNQCCSSRGLGLVMVSLHCGWTPNLYALGLN